MPIRQQTANNSGGVGDPCQNPPYLTFVWCLGLAKLDQMNLLHQLVKQDR